MKMDIKMDMNRLELSNSFIVLCELGELEEAQSLYEENLDLNISVSQLSIALEFACINGHIDIAKWLLEINPNLDIGNAFKWSCKTGWLPVAQWIESLEPTLYKIIYNDDGSYKDYCIYSKNDV